MPVDIKAECESIGLHPFRAAELQLIEDTKGTDVLVYDTEKTVETMVNNNTLMDNNIHTVGMYIEGCLNRRSTSTGNWTKLGHLSYQDL